MSSNSQKPKLNEQTYLNALVGQKVKLTFLDGESMEATFVCADRYQLFVKDGNRVFMVFKHALRHIVPADGGEGR